MEDKEKDQIKQAFAQRFRLALKQAGYAVNQQKDMANLFKVSGQAVHKWADGASMPTSTRMTNIARVLGVRRAWLQDGEAPMRPIAAMISDEKGDYVVDPSPAIWMSEEEAKLIQAYRTLQRQQKKVIQDIVAVFYAARSQ